MDLKKVIELILSQEGNFAKKITILKTVKYVTPNPLYGEVTLLIDTVGNTQRIRKLANKIDSVCYALFGHPVQVKLFSDPVYLFEV